MALPAGDTRDALIRQLEADPWRYDYYQLMRLVESAWPDRARLGTSIRAAHEPVRVGQEPTVAFPPSSISSIRFERAAPSERVEDDGAPARGPEGRLRIVIHAFGLLGPNGPMPLHITEYVRDRDKNHRDSTLRAFLDLFHHRMACLLYRAWASSRPTVSRDRPWDDHFGRYVSSLVGVGMPSFEERDATSDDAKRFHAGAIGKAARGPMGLASVLRDDLGAPVQIEEFVGRWVEAPPACRTRLGADRASGMLGQTVFVGERFWDCQQTFRVVIGPVSLKTFESLLPGTPGFRRLRDWVRLYTGRLLRCEAQLVLKKHEVPPARLGAPAGGGLGSRLGWTTWLRSTPAERDADEAVFIVEA